MYIYLLSPLNNQLAHQPNNNPGYKFIRNFTLVTLHIEFAPNIYISLQVWEEVYLKGRSRELKGAEIRIP